MRMKFIRSLPEMCARTRCPLSSWTLNIVLGRGSMTVPSTSMASFLATDLGTPLSRNDAGLPGRPTHEPAVYQEPAGEANGWEGEAAARDDQSGEGRPAAGPQTWVRISGPWSVTATVCSKWAAREPSRVTTVQ